VGRTADGTFTLDIRNDGPHGLVGGTTGAGKSEFLQTWIMSMATTFSPETVTFLLVDYKGGAAFKDCSRLPHSVGMVTDLDPAGIMRALISLGAEVRRREILQDKHNCSSLLDMIDKGIPEAPPSLLIIVDEFAALVQEVPEFIEGMVDIAQRGRSLGVHLILATQRPAGVITGQIKANTDLRVALRTSDTEDSSDVIESPAAADIDRNTPGRAITRIGRKRTQFQTAYVGGVTDGDQAEVEVAMARFEFDGLSPLETTTVKPPGESNVPTDLERLVDNLGDAFAQTGRPLPRRPWLDPLQSLYNLTALAEAAEGDLTLGMVDHPDEQAQVPFHFRLDTDGSLGVIGSGGSGKTVTLRTIAASAALMADEADELPIVYGLDFAGRGLQMLEEMPHVAGVVADDDPERVRRVMADLELLLEERTRLSAEARASSFPELRRATTSPIQRRILLIDGYPAFHQMFENVEGDRWINIVRRLILEGRQYGLHVVISAARRELIYSTVARAVSRWVVLRQTSVDDYRNLEVPVDLLGEEPDPGRAIVGRNLAQIAILGDRSETADQVNAIKTLAEDLRQKGVPDAPPIRLLPVEVSRRDLVDRRALGLRDRDFSQWTMPDDFRIFLIAGPRSSGKTAALVAAGRAVTEGNQDPDPNLQVVYLTPKPPTIDLPSHWQVAVGEMEVRDHVDRLLSEAADRRLIMVDDAAGLADMGLPMAQLADGCDGGRQRMLATMEDTKARSGFDVLARTLRAPRFGLLLRPNPIDDKDVFGLPLPRVKSHLWPAGRGYVIDDQSVELIQVAYPN
jgi:S-DNA-T family DNA segregation ATPase FtsK/SpoIIIE